LLINYLSIKFSFLFVHILMGPSIEDRFRRSFPVVYFRRKSKVPHVGSSSADDFSFHRPAPMLQRRNLVFLASALSTLVPIPRPFPLFPPRTLSLVTVWRLDFLLNSFGKKLRCRNGDSLFSHSLIPRDNPRAVCINRYEDIFSASRIPFNSLQNVHMRLAG